MNPYLKPTNTPIGRGSNERTPLWIYILSALPMVIAWIITVMFSKGVV